MRCIATAVSVNIWEESFANEIRGLAVNWVLNKDRVKKMLERFSSDGGIHLTRTSPEHAIKVTIEERAVKPLLTALSQKSTTSGDIIEEFRKTSLGPLNQNGQIFDMSDQHFNAVKNLTKFRVEAGQHRLAVAESLETINNAGCWPAMIFVRKFSNRELISMRVNKDQWQFKDSTEDLLFQLAPYFRALRNNQVLNKEDADAYHAKKNRLGGKIKTALNKVWGHVLQRLIGDFPHIGTGWSQNQAGVLNGSIHNDVSDCDASQ